MTDYSRDALLSFLDYAAEKGLMNPNTASSRKATVATMLSILDDEEAHDIRTLDLEDVYRKFANIYSRKYSPESLRVYRSRLKTAIEDFVRFSDNPATFKPSSGSKPQKRPPVAKAETLPAAVAAKNETVGGTVAQAAAFQSISVPIPLRGTCVVTIHGIPLDITELEAKRIANVVLALASSN